MTTLRTLFTISAVLDLELYQMDNKYLDSRKRTSCLQTLMQPLWTETSPYLWYKKFDSFMLQNKVSTTPDIAYAVGVVRRFMSQPGQNHSPVVKSLDISRH